MEAKAGAREAKGGGQGPHLGTQGHQNSTKSKPKAPKGHSLEVLDRTSEQLERPNSKNLKKGTLPSTIFLPKIHPKPIKNTPRSIKLSIEKIHMFSMIVH